MQRIDEIAGLAVAFMQARLPAEYEALAGALIELIGDGPEADRWIEAWGQLIGDLAVAELRGATVGRAEAGERLRGIVDGGEGRGAVDLDR